MLLGRHKHSNLFKYFFCWPCFRRRMLFKKVVKYNAEILTFQIIIDCLALLLWFKLLPLSDFPIVKLLQILLVILRVVVFQECEKSCFTKPWRVSKGALNCPKLIQKGIILHYLIRLITENFNLLGFWIIHFKIILTLKIF